MCWLHRQISSCGDGETPGGCRTAPARPGHAVSPYFTPDGKFLFSGGADGVGDLWDLQDRHVDFRTYGHSDRIYGVAISTDHNGQPEFLYTGGRDDTLRSYVFTFGSKKLAESAPTHILAG
jgi:WD40 repeat protein